MLDKCAKMLRDWIRKFFTPKLVNDDDFMEKLAEKVRERIEACIEAAKLNGHTEEEAYNCKDGALGCPNCPYVP